MDISEYGLGLISEVTLEKGDILQILLPAISDTTLPVFAEVRWLVPFNSVRVDYNFWDSEVFLKQKGYMT